MSCHFICTIKSKKIAVYLFLVLVCGACATPSATATPTRPVYVVTVSGASAMAPLLNALIEAFEPTSSEVRVQVQIVNTAWGLAQLRQGQADLAAVAAEPPADLWHAPIALDGIALIVHPDNPLDTLTDVQAQALFSGRLWHWADLGVTVAEDEITVVSREEGSGDRATFERRLMKGVAVTPAAVLLYGTAAVVDFVATHPGAIGYVSQGAVSAQVKMLRLEDVAPTSETIAQQRYGLIRPFFLVATQEPDGPARAFLDFCLSQQGQAIVAQRYAPVRGDRP